MHTKCGFTTCENITFDVHSVKKRFIQFPSLKDLDPSVAHRTVLQEKKYN